MTSMITTVLFDLDGTLLDTAPDLAAAINKTLIHYNYEPVDFEKFRNTIYAGSHSMLCDSFDMDDTHEHYSERKDFFLQRYREDLVSRTTLFPGMQDVLNHIKNQNMQWGIITNKPAWLTEPLIAQMHFKDDIKCLLSGDSLDQRKPHPAPLLHACQQLNILPQQAIYVGDTETDIIAAREANMPSIAVHYGYHEKQSNPNDWGATYTVKKALEIKQLI